jgi:hypothetical protein
MSVFNLLPLPGGEGWGEGWGEGVDLLCIVANTKCASNANDRDWLLTATTLSLNPSPPGRGKEVCL